MVTTPELRRRSAAAVALRAGGILLWVAAGIHFVALPLLQATVSAKLTPEAYAFVGPPLSFTFLVNGILLLPLGFTAIYCAPGVYRGERWARALGLVCGVVVLLLPFVLVLVMGFRYFSAKPFLVAAVAVTAAGLLMTIPLLRIPRGEPGV